MKRDYNDAVTTLNTLQSNSFVVDAIKKSGRGMNKLAIPEMIEWCRKIGYEPSDFNSLKAIHIAGTKGKGSTSAFISSILTQYSRSRSFSGPKKVGLYTSPHLRFVRERIQINNQPLSEKDFAKYFFETWDRLESAAQESGQPSNASAKPVYFRFLTLMAFHTYMSEGVDTAVIECGIGGEYDSTNILVQPTVTGVTSLGIDHTAMLGSTLPEIAWHKAGIMKSGARAFTVPQDPNAMAVLLQRAEEKGVDLVVVERHPAIETITLGLAADFQKSNASLAIEVAAEHLRMIGHAEMRTDLLPAEFVSGLSTVQWGGRCETRCEEDVTWYLDGAHTLESVQVAGEWFAGCLRSATASTTPLNKPAPKILIFNQQTRAGIPLLSVLHKVLSEELMKPQPFTHALFCSNTTFVESGFKPDLMNMNVDKDVQQDLSVQKTSAKGWVDINVGVSGAEGDGGIIDIRASTKEDWTYEHGVTVVRTIEEAIQLARGIAKQWKQDEGGTEKGETKVLVTGSLHLVGGFLDVLETGTTGL